MVDRLVLSHAAWGIPAALLGYTRTPTSYGYVPLARGTGIHGGIPLKGYPWGYMLDFWSFSTIIRFLLDLVLVGSLLNKDGGCRGHFREAQKYFMVILRGLSHMLSIENSKKPPKSAKINCKMWSGMGVGGY